MNVVSRHDLETAIASLMKSASIFEPVEEIIPMRAGGNNRTYCIETSSARYVVKHYFQHKGDKRDRLQSEYAFLGYAEQAEVAAVPCSLAQDPQSGMALYEYIAGEAIQSGEIGQAEVDAAIMFFLALNEPTARKAAEKLPQASEAAFSLHEHLENTEHRIRQLQQIVLVDEEDHKGAIVIQSIATFWGEYRNRVLEAVNHLGWRVDESIACDQRCISPSDFGFHNAIRSQNDGLVFHDFEYFGWDDPVKLISDFSHHAAMSLSNQLEQLWFSGVSTIYGKHLLNRLSAAWPLYGLNWCLIILNEFKDEVWNRRCAADERKLNQRELHLSTQLAKSKSKLDNLAISYKNKHYW